jgi:hypothetical protein
MNKLDKALMDELDKAKTAKGKGASLVLPVRLDGPDGDRQLKAIANPPQER